MFDCLRDKSINDGLIVKEDADFPNEALAFAEALKTNNTVTSLNISSKLV